MQSIRTFSVCAGSSDAAPSSNSRRPSASLPEATSRKTRGAGGGSVEASFWRAGVGVAGVVGAATATAGKWIEATRRSMAAVAPGWRSEIAVANF